MLENIFTNVFGRSKSRTSANSGGRDSVGQLANTSQGSSGIHPPPTQMTGPFSMSTSQMPQPPSLPYPPPAPYPSSSNLPPSPYYPSLPFSQPTPQAPGSQAQWPPLPGDALSRPSISHQPFNYPTGTLASNQFSPLDSVPFEAKLTLNNSTNLVSLDQLFKEIKKAADVVDRADAYLRSNQSDYDFKVEQGLIYQ